MKKVYVILGGVVGFILLFLLLGGLAIVLKGQYDKRVIADHESKQKVAVHDSINVDLTAKRDSVRIVYVDRWHSYTTYRDSAVRANPANKPLIELAQKCDQLILTCGERHAIDSAQIENQRAEIQLLKKMKAAKPARISAFALAGYDWYNGKPIAQIGGDVRMVGALSVTGYIEAAKAEANSPEPVVTRGVIAAKFTFR